MSLSKPWNHGSHHPFPHKQNFDLYRDVSSSLLPAFSLSTFSPFAMNALSPDEMERFQRLSNTYQPDVQPSHSIALDYANADPTLAAKTNTESSRIKSLNTLLDQIGLADHIYEIFVDATEDILKRIIDAIQSGVQDESFLVEAFNEGYSSDAVITHFRLLTGAWIKLNPGRYLPFLPMPVDQYCSTRIDPVKTEIDEVGLQALIHGVIEGSGFGVEILYLDRSEGDAVTPHQLTTNCPSGATLRLLYRPGHYDILYQAESTLNVAPIVNLQYGLSSDYTNSWDNATLGFDMNSSLMAIPNLMQDSSFGMGASMSPMPSVSPAPPSPYGMSPQQEMYPPMQSHPPIASISSPHPPPSSAPPPMTSLPSRSSDGPQIRLNPLVMKPNLSRSLPVTTPFKNSPYNQAHFQNSDFEPIHWEPHGR
ncbi:unnamed protein product [Penicillium olsonii]|nr:unnamed protein product [Penicillium olsonii]CAG7926273.1 unnamed protein product [Penicillium olsonii]